MSNRGHRSQPCSRYFTQIMINIVDPSEHATSGDPNPSGVGQIVRCKLSTLLTVRVWEYMYYVERRLA